MPEMCEISLVFEARINTSINRVLGLRIEQEAPWIFRSRKELKIIDVISQHLEKLHLEMSQFLKYLGP